MSQITEERILAARVAARSELRDVRLFSDTSTLNAVPAWTGRFSYALDLEPEYEWDDGDDFFVIKCRYSVNLHEEPAPDRQTEDTSLSIDDEDTKVAHVATLQFVYGALFTLKLREGDVPPTPDELAAYAKTTGSFALYPFAREYVRDLTSRMGLPPLVLGVLIQPISKLDEPTDG